MDMQNTRNPQKFEPHGNYQLYDIVCRSWYDWLMTSYWLPNLPPWPQNFIIKWHKVVYTTSCCYVSMIIVMYHGPGIPVYNCFINANKTVKNFDVTESGEAKITADGMYAQYNVHNTCVALRSWMMLCTTIITTGPQWLPWCGYLVNTATLEIHVDYSRYSFTGKWGISHHMDGDRI